MDQSIEAVLSYAQEVYEELRFLPTDKFDRWVSAERIINSGVFTVPQTAKIVGMNPVYLQQLVRNRIGRADTSKRSRSGVSGNFNPESLLGIRVLRNQWYSRKDRARVDTDIKRQILEILDAGNGVALIEYLTEVPASILNRTRREREK